MEDRTVLDSLLCYTDQLLADSTPEAPAWNIEVKRSGEANRWNYIDGCMISAVLDLFEVTGKRAYLDFAEEYVGWFVQPDGSIRRYDKNAYDIDSIRAGFNLFRLYDLTGDERFRQGMNTLRAQLESQPRTAEGSFWHKGMFPMQVWLDGLYMGQPFYAEYEKRYRQCAGFADTLAQFQRAEQYMRDGTTGLYYHGYDESRAMFWADDDTGLNECFWLRSIGWFFLALVDCAVIFGDEFPKGRRELVRILGDLASSLVPFQHACGMFWQVPDQPALAGNYLETSGTMLIATGMLRAVRHGMLPVGYREAAQRAFYGTAEKYLTLHPGGGITLGGICIMAGLGENENQDGTPRYYFSEAVVENESKGVAPMLYALAELLRLQG